VGVGCGVCEVKVPCRLRVKQAIGKQLDGPPGVGRSAAILHQQAPSTDLLSKACLVLGAPLNGRAEVGGLRDVT